MTDAAIKDSLIAQLDRLPYNLQLRILDFAKALAPTGVAGKVSCALREKSPLKTYT